MARNHCPTRRAPRGKDALVSLLPAGPRSPRHPRRRARPLAKFDGARRSGPSRRIRDLAQRAKHRPLGGDRHRGRAALQSAQRHSSKERLQHPRLPSRGRRRRTRAHHGARFPRLLQRARDRPALGAHDRPPEPAELPPGQRTTRRKPSSPPTSSASPPHRSTPPIEPIPGKRVPPSRIARRARDRRRPHHRAAPHEPQVAQPTHVSFDARGRMWVSQYRQYPYPAGVKMLSRDQYYRSKYDKTPPAPPYHDRGADIISVHADTDGDGTFDSAQEHPRRPQHGQRRATRLGRLLGHAHALPALLPGRRRRRHSGSCPEVRLAGFGLEDTHSVANGLAWGPDGWLYGGQGSTTTSRVTRPDVDKKDAEGVYNEGCMVWRYHPTDKRIRNLRRRRRQHLRAVLRRRRAPVQRAQRRQHARLAPHPRGTVPQTGQEPGKVRPTAEPLHLRRATNDA